MKNFTEVDIHVSDFQGTKLESVYADPHDLVKCELEWQKKGLRETNSGYGRKLTTDNKICFNGKLYRIYCSQFANVGSFWFTVKGKKIYVN